MRVAKRILIHGNIAGYVLVDKRGKEVPMMMDDIVKAVKKGTITLENARVAHTAAGIESLRGRNCKLTQLPGQNTNPDDPLVYRCCHAKCWDCRNNGREPLCSECIAANDGHGYITEWEK